MHMYVKVKTMSGHAVTISKLLFSWISSLQKIVYLAANYQCVSIQNNFYVHSYIRTILSWYFP
jgi:hypothetical protein